MEEPLPQTLDCMEKHPFKLIYLLFLIFIILSFSFSSLIAAPKRKPSMDALQDEDPHKRLICQPPSYSLGKTYAKRIKILQSFLPFIRGLSQLEEKQIVISGPKLPDTPLAEVTENLLSSILKLNTNNLPQINARLPDLLTTFASEHFTPSTQKEELIIPSCYTIAANLGYAPAMFLLGELYYYGHCGLPKDRQLAFSLYCRAYESGYRNALPELIHCHTHGIGTRKQLHEAQDLKHIGHNFLKRVKRDPLIGAYLRGAYLPDARVITFDDIDIEVASYEFKSSS